MEQWLPPSHESTADLTRADGGDLWTVLSSQRRARSPSRLTAFSDVNGLSYLGSLPKPITIDSSPKKRDPLADMLPDSWEPTQKLDPIPSTETPPQPENKAQPTATAQTQNRTPLSADDLAPDMPWNSVSSRKRPTKIRQSQAKPKAKPSKGAGSTSPSEPDKSTDSTSPHDGLALRRSPRISQLNAHQKLQKTTPPPSRSEVENDIQKSKSGPISPIPRKRKARPHATETLETSGSDTRYKAATTLPAKPSKVPRLEQASPAKGEPAAKDSEAARPRAANRDIRTPAEPEDEVFPHDDRTEKHIPASNKLQSPNEPEESVLSYHNRVERQDSTTTGVQTSNELEEMLQPPHESTQKIDTQLIYQNQAIQQFGSQPTSEDAFLAKTTANLMAVTQYEQRPFRKQAALVHDVANESPRRISRDAVSSPAPKDIVPSHVAHVWDRLAQREPQILDLGQAQEAVPVLQPTFRGQKHHGVNSELSSSPLFMGQGPVYDDDQEPGVAPRSPRNMFRNGLETFKVQVLHRNTAPTLRKQPSHDQLPVQTIAQQSDLAYSLPHAANLTNEFQGTPVQRPQSQWSASTPLEQSRAASRGEVWRRETEDNSTYAILHKIGMMLHRALKPSEEVVDDIIKDYLENSVLLLELMNTCHETERETTVENHEAATKRLYSMFDTALQDVRHLQEQLQSFDISKILASARRPELVKKMHMLNRLCDERLREYVEQSSRATTEEEDPVPKKDDLVELFKTQLYEQIGHSVDVTTKLQMIDAEADEFIENLRNEIGFPSRQSDAQRVSDEPEPAFQAIKQDYNAMFGSKQKKPASAGEILSDISQEVIEVSSHYDSDSDYVD
ncbi:hypothetical protein NEUTE1DRAFT_89812 [Neurospora tetrasperma FGSC 2508]|uniref:Uncharacterized protein n=1 Tax=Neurospora tetrasperma (strain FGSC 2508 / ATCC MYA-4615 / P0657) TaxID=510951 RepID=F8MYW2_NEUT8|nr:uncharacterized protein NEUTE1DRAFT_89812 [Neurospora tetrasperma FGSC 2508]EGO51960.1 hypothetical protein NEUTE1DRAFT_89812 [Neurospora tetrasperma FGSC 2508]